MGKVHVKDTHRETPSNKTKALTKSMNVHIWKIGKLNLLLIRGPYTEIEFSKKIISGKSAFVVIILFYTSHSIYP